MLDGDEILIYTMTEHSMLKAVRRNLKLALCVLDEIWPPTDLNETGYSPRM